MTGTLHDELFAFMISRLILLIMRNISDRVFRQNKKKTHFVLKNIPPPETRAVYEIMWENMVERGRPQMTI
jgi:hypothetical protein